MTREVGLIVKIGRTVEVLFALTVEWSIYTDSVLGPAARQRPGGNLNDQAHSAGIQVRLPVARTELPCHGNGTAASLRLSAVTRKGVDTAHTQAGSPPRLSGNLPVAY